SLTAGWAALSRVPQVRRAAAGLIERTSRTDTAAREGQLTETVIGEWGLQPQDMENAAGHPARLTAWTLPRVDPQAIRERRRRHAELEPLRAGLLALPVHHSLAEWHVERVREAARKVLLG